MKAELQTKVSRSESFETVTKLLTDAEGIITNDLSALYEEQNILDDKKKKLKFELWYIEAKQKVTQCSEVDDESKLVFSESEELINNMTKQNAAAAEYNMICQNESIDGGSTSIKGVTGNLASTDNLGSIGHLSSKDNLRSTVNLSSTYNLASIGSDVSTGSSDTTYFSFSTCDDDSTCDEETIDRKTMAQYKSMVEFDFSELNRKTTKILNAIATLIEKMETNKKNVKLLNEELIYVRSKLDPLF